MMKLVFLPLLGLLPFGAPVPCPGDLALTPGGGPLTITCPPLEKVFCGSSLHPDALGYPEVLGGCDPTPNVTWSDAPVFPTSCPADRFDRIITRTWTATDSCGNSASCTQSIDVIKQLWKLDIKPGSCPNPINVGKGGAVSIAIVGTAAQDVSLIDPATVRIWRQGCAAGPVIPDQVNIQDVATPLTVGGQCACHDLGADGIPDLRLRFDRSLLVAGLGLHLEPKNSHVRLIVTAQLYDGCELIADDCVRVQ